MPKRLSNEWRRAAAYLMRCYHNRNSLWYGDRVVVDEANLYRRLADEYDKCHPPWNGPCNLEITPDGELRVLDDRGCGVSIGRLDAAALRQLQAVAGQMADELEGVDDAD